MLKEEYIRGLIDDLKDVKYISPEDIPNIDLYMDQVTTFMDRHLRSSKRFSEDKLLTKTMINNYTKNELLPPPNKKKYSKEHMFLLIFIYYYKNILSISDIQSIFNPLTQRYFGDDSQIPLEDIYEEIFRLEKEQTEALTKDMIRKMNKAKESFSEVTDKEDHDFLTVFSFISMLCFDVYMRKHMIEKIIDSSLMGGGSSKDTSKKPEPKKAVNKPEPAAKTAKAVSRPDPMAKTAKAVSRPDPMAKTGKAVNRPDPMAKTGKAVNRPDPMAKTAKVVNRHEPTIKAAKAVNKP